MKQAFLNIIRAHKVDTPVQSAYLEDYFKISGAKVRGLIRELRREGELICSNDHGYYYTYDHSEAEKTAKNLEMRAHSLLKTASEMRNKFTPDGQFKLF